MTQPASAQDFKRTRNPYNYTGEPVCQGCLSGFPESPGVYNPGYKYADELCPTCTADYIGETGETPLAKREPFEIHEGMTVVDLTQPVDLATVSPDIREWLTDDSHEDLLTKD